MCPVCIATAVLIAGSAASGGGFAAVAMREFGMKNAVDIGASVSQRLRTELVEELQPGDHGGARRWTEHDSGRVQRSDPFCC